MAKKGLIINQNGWRILLKDHESCMLKIKRKRWTFVNNWKDKMVLSDALKLINALEKRRIGRFFISFRTFEMSLRIRSRIIFVLLLELLMWLLICLLSSVLPVILRMFGPNHNFLGLSFFRLINDSLFLSNERKKKNSNGFCLSCIFWRYASFLQIWLWHKDTCVGLSVKYI